MIKMIAAVSINGVIGVDNKLPWNYPADMKYFRTSTANSTVIMGRKTFESVGCRALPKRRNIVISSKVVDSPNIETFGSLETALSKTEGDVWLIGGAGIYEEGMTKKYVDKIYLTLVPDFVNSSNAVKFPFINPRLFKAESLQFVPGDEEQVLRLAIYTKIKLELI
jgi:dihydrofolate reductase